MAAGVARTWRSARDWRGEVDPLAFVSDDGARIEPGGWPGCRPGCWEVRAEVDGRAWRCAIYPGETGRSPQAEADLLLDRLAAGWRPVNW